MPILSFKVSKEVAETVNTLAKRNGISRNEFLTRAIISLLLQEDLKGKRCEKAHRLFRNIYKETK